MISVSTTRRRTGEVTVLVPICCTVEYDYTPGTPDVPLLKTGDPGNPGEGARCEVTSIVERWFGDHPIEGESREQRLVDAVLRSNAEEVQRQLLADCENEN